MTRGRLAFLVGLGLTTAPAALATLVAQDNPTNLTLANDRLSVSLNKSRNLIDRVYLDGVNLLGLPVDNTSAIGPYVDAVLPPSIANYVPGDARATVEVVNGTDSGGTAWGGIVLRQPDAEGTVGMTLEQYFFLRDNETSLHAFTRVAYENATTPNLGEFTQLRTLFRPHGYFFTHLSASDDFSVPQPRPNPAIDSTHDLGVATQVQDTTWYIGNRTDDPFVEQVADYYTKYSLSNTYRNQTVHGLFADGTNTPDNSTWGAWTVYNTKDTFFGGPTYSDLTVDGLVYNYIISNHHGDSVPNITTGFDRTFGPALLHFNHGSVGGSLQTLRDDAQSLADVTFGAQFYDDIAHLVPGYVTSSGRGAWKASLVLPDGSSNALAVLTAPGYDPQDNVYDTSAYQYWAPVSSDGSVEIDRVKAGSYRLTVYADGIFGDYVHPGTVDVSGGQTTDGGSVTWTAESAGEELWRLGVPDKSAGEYRHGYETSDRPLHPPEYRIYWGAYDYVNDFPDGVNFIINSSTEAQDWNYVQWSSFGGTLTRPGVVADPKVNNWTISFDLDSGRLEGMTNATFTVQLAGVATAAGNTDSYSSKTPYSNLPYVVSVNGKQLDPWVIPYYHSSSCATRSAVTCYQVRNKLQFPSAYLLSNATNQMVLSLPFNVSGISVLYDALRLEVA